MSAAELEREIEEYKVKVDSLKQLKDESEASKIKTGILELNQKIDLLESEMNKLATHRTSVWLEYDELCTKSADLYFDTLKLHKFMKQNQIWLEKLIDTENADEVVVEEEEEISDELKNKLKMKIYRMKASMKIFEETFKEAKISGIAIGLPVLGVGSSIFFLGISAAALLLYR